MKARGRKMFPLGLGFGLVLVGVSTVALWRYEYFGLSRIVTVPRADQANDPTKHIMTEAVEDVKAELERLKADKERMEQLSDEMKSELATLRSQLSQVDQNQESLGREINKVAEAGRTGGKGPDEPALTPKEERERAEAHTRAQLASLEGAMQAEQPDPAWVSEAQSALNEAFDSETMTGMQLMEADCRTSLCRLELFLDGSVSPEDGFRKLTHLAPWQGQGFVHFDEDGAAVLYLAREGRSLPQARE